MVEISVIKKANRKLQRHLRRKTESCKEMVIYSYLQEKKEGDS
jgi:hypothetical protein